MHNTKGKVNIKNKHTTNMIIYEYINISEKMCNILFYEHEFCEKCGKSKYSNMAITETSGQYSGFDGFPNS